MSSRFPPGPASLRLTRQRRIPAEDGLYAALFALTNGVIGLRGSLLLHAGFYGEGRNFEREIVAAADPLWLRVGIAGRECDPLETSQTLDMGHAHLERRATYACDGTTVRVTTTLAVPAGTAGDFIVAEIRLERVAGDAPASIGLDTRPQTAGATGALAVATRIQDRDGPSFTAVLAVAVAPTPAAAAESARRSLDEAIDVDAILARHREIWRQRWAAAPSIGGDDEALAGLRFGYFHLAQAPDRRRNAIALPPRGLTSTQHGGLSHFNTEVSAVPYYALAEPDVARRLLAFRAATLDQSRRYASASGFAGARIPLFAGPDGAPVRSRHPAHNTIAETSCHGTADLVRAIATFGQYTGEWPGGADSAGLLLASCADFLASLVDKNRAGGLLLTGFDEYHPAVPGHFATLALARWALRWVSRCELPSFTAEQRARWNAASRSVALPQPRSGVYPQFDGYFALPDPTCKQADVVAALAMIARGGGRPALRANLQFYEPWTEHASCLSFAPHALAAARTGDLALAWRLTRRALRYNLDYTPREDYGNGVHLDAYAGACTTLLRGFLSFQTSRRRAIMRLNMPRELGELTVSFHYRGHRLTARATATTLDLDAPSAVAVRRAAPHTLILHVPEAATA